MVIAIKNLLVMWVGEGRYVKDNWELIENNRD